jgi:WD40 repeat protein
MKIVSLFFLFLIFSFSVPAQSNQPAQTGQPVNSLIKEIGDFDFENPAEKIIQVRFLDGGAKLWLLGTNTIQVWDIRNKKVISSEKHNIDDLADRLEMTQSWDKSPSLSPDGQKLFLTRFKAYKEKTWQPACIFDLKTLRYLKVFDESVESGKWSKDGGTFVSIKKSVTVKADDSEKIEENEVSFWNGDTFAPLSTIKVNALGWNYLTPGGDHFFTTSVPMKKWLFGIPYRTSMASLISVWDPRTGKLEKELSAGGEDFAVLTWKLMPSPSGRYMVMVSKHKSNDEEHRLLFWELDGSDSPKYAIKANPKIADSTISYSPDEKLFAIDAGKNIQIYQAGTGQKKIEIQDTTLPDYWVDNDQIIYSKGLTKMRAFKVATGNLIYENPLIYEAYDDTYTDSNGQSASYGTVVTDFTTVVPCPDGKAFLAHSNQFARLYNTQNGELLETLVRPPLSLIKQKYAIREKRYVADAGWSDNGKMIYVVNYEKSLVTLWDFKG